MVTIRSYTAVEQSRALAEFLPLDSADMFWYKDAVTKEANPRIMNYMQVPELQSIYYSPCWSLAALLSLLKRKLVSNHGEVYSFECEPFECDGEPLWLLRYVEIHDEAEPIEADANTELLDACYELILKLHDNNLL